MQHPCRARVIAYHREGILFISVQLEFPGDLLTRTNLAKPDSPQPACSIDLNIRQMRVRSTREDGMWSHSVGLPGVVSPVHIRIHRSSESEGRELGEERGEMEGNC
jgi:hypothetical protein